MTPDFYDLFKTDEQPRVAAHPVAFAGDTTAYAAKALANEVDAVTSAANGTRNDTLNKAGYSMAQLVAAGHITERDVHAALTDAASSVGLDDDEIAKTLHSSLGAGKLQPRVVPEQEPIGPASVLTVDDVDVTDADTISALIRERLPLLDWHALWGLDDEEEWILEPLLPARRLVALFSAPKVGKSILMLEVAVGVSKGTEVLGVVPDRPRRVLYVDFENDPRGDIRERLQAMGQSPDDLTNLCYMSYPQLAKLDTAAGGADLMAAVAEYGCEVVIIDTISRAVGGEENENDTWLNFYRNCGMRMKAAGVSCMRLDHTGKDHDKGMRGGSAKYGDVDAVWKLARVDEHTFMLTCTDNRMQVDEKTLTLRRELTPHLTHRVASAGRDASWAASVDAVNAELDRAGLSDDVSNRAAKDHLRTTGVFTGRNGIIEAALRARKTRIQVLEI